MFVFIISVIILSVVIIGLSLKIYVKLVDCRYRSRNGLTNDETIVAFFHPFCNSGGGGERVLWVALRALRDKYPDCHYVVYTGDVEAKPEEILAKARNHFKIDLDDSSIRFVYLKRRYLIGCQLYPYFTLLGQSIGSVGLGLEALFNCRPNIFIDSMGYSFTFPVFKYLGGSRVVAYVHYPTISTDMLELVAQTRTSYNNRSFISNSPVLTKAKLMYYKLFAYLYGLMGRMAEIVMVNSSWTKGHVEHIWQREARTVYPPCNTSDLKQLSLANKNRLKIVSIGQIRPEKNHKLQLMAFKEFIDRLAADDNKSVAKLVIIGSCRDSDDEQRLDELKKLCHKLEIDDKVDFKINIPYDELKRQIEESSIGLHTMINEHFGIGVVECLASGLVTVTHDSGGPKLDLIRNETNGFLATDLHNFAEILYKIANLSDRQLMDIRVTARNSSDRFSEQQFETLFLQSIESVF
ncbi:GDP-Man:Man(3)GlcNAc(2)-PP-Dol alpha-1,2-mannosyltransferase-like [Oppia nitens]|uniref:GDP-Man:Man(3)GlcNAc(2)-PP-Dol alpha-1,2-mannosyltransferase-like n=1 Tax=Oppia nitens TaxID=1686743 RepID=UPI0023DB95A4|nr:GDP-Man:Man(3)GlcNAc(2)-PP-Dol alpha-1,2-mannosyltransferase-like [Oppia nitens]XP_054166307.1 GDP-Man:Man(3)GlcNAc(2)-PP-Dol alpha-1,2-mannosyltransferase-like [Oppia nitens]XP_054166421.1 GDP-Man:Man(3)GlcNAc(2)-PP-Dol alpha-1,2-mannosyltransferase-like [Oppia nitens]